MFELQWESAEEGRAPSRRCWPADSDLRGVAVLQLLVVGARLLTSRLNSLRVKRERRFDLPGVQRAQRGREEEHPATNIWVSACTFNCLLADLQSAALRRCLKLARSLLRCRSGVASRSLLLLLSMSSLSAVWMCVPGPLTDAAVSDQHDLEQVVIFLIEVGCSSRAEHNQQHPSQQRHEHSTNEQSSPL